MINEEAVKDSFKKIKGEMRYLASEISYLKNQIQDIYDLLTHIDLINSANSHNNQSSTSTTDIRQIEQNPADNPYYNGELSLNYPSSIGNEGVPADTQQTVSRQIAEKTYENYIEEPRKELNDSSKISSLIDGLKNDLKQKFQSLTKQEFLIFSLIYTLTDENGEANYKELALRSKLTESSIRDYISRLEHKGIPLIKEKKNNKLVVIRVPKELRDIAALDSLVKLNKI